MKPYTEVILIIAAVWSSITLTYIWMTIENIAKKMQTRPDLSADLAEDKI